MEDQRKTARSLMIVLGLFILLATGLLAIRHLSESRSGMLATTRPEELREQLADSTNADAMIEQIREEDSDLRKTHWGNRRAYDWAGYMLLIAIVGWVASARWFYSLARVPAPSILNRALQAKRQSAAENDRKMALYTVGGSAGALLLILLGLAIFISPQLPPEGWDKSAAGLAGGSETAEKVPPPPNWPFLRGADNLGIAAAGDWLTTWTAGVTTATWTLGGMPQLAAGEEMTSATTRNVLWKVPVPLEGKSSPVVWGNRLFLTAADLENQHVLCYDTESGEMLWDRRVDVTPPEGIDEFEPWEETGIAAATGATDGERFFAAFATGDVVAFDFDGKQLWVKELGIPDSMYSFSTSLIVYEKSLILQLDQGMDEEDELSKLLAFDTATGRITWSVPRPVGASWASPAFVRTEKRVELITCASPWVIAYDPASGTELWRYEGLSGDVAPSPAYVPGGPVYVTNDGADLLAIPLGGAGVLTDEQILWRAADGLPDTASPLTDGKYVFQQAGGGYITCFNAKDGALLWEEYLESGATASPILAGGLVYLACEDGATYVLKLGDTFKLVDKGDVGEPIFATPAFLPSRIYIRGMNHLFCIGKPEEK